MRYTEDRLHVHRPKHTVHHMYLLAIHSLFCIQQTSDITDVLGQSLKSPITKLYCTSNYQEKVQKKT